MNAKEKFPAGASCTVNGSGDLMCDRTEGAFIGKDCEIIKVTKAGYVQVRLKSDARKIASLPQRNIEKVRVTQV